MLHKGKGGTSRIYITVLPLAGKKKSAGGKPVPREIECMEGFLHVGQYGRTKSHRGIHLLRRRRERPGKDHKIKRFSVAEGDRWLGGRKGASWEFVEEGKGRNAAKKIAFGIFQIKTPKRERESGKREKLTIEVEVNREREKTKKTKR